MGISRVPAGRCVCQTTREAGGMRVISKQQHLKLRSWLPLCESCDAMPERGAEPALKGVAAAAAAAAAAPSVRLAG